MAQPVNLNKARKARAKSERKTKADANALKHGRARAERERDTKVADQARRRLDAHKRDT